MQSTQTQSADYASLSLPRKNTQALKAQAVTLLASVETNIRRNPELREKFNRKHFELRLSSVFNQNTVIRSIRAAAHPESLLRGIEKSFYNFKIATLLLETKINPEVEDAVITLIANAAMEKRGLSQAPAEIKKTVAARTVTAVRNEEPASPQAAEKNDEQEIADKKRPQDELKAARKNQHKIDRELKKEEDRRTLALMRPLMEKTQAQLLRESMSSPADHDPVKTAEAAQQVLTYINRALELKLVNVMGGQKYLATAFHETFNRHAALTDLQAQTPQLAKKVRGKFRHTLIAATRLKVKLNPYIKSAIIDELIQETKDEAAKTRERIYQTAVKNGQSETSRETSRKRMIEMRNDPVKAAAHNERARKRIRELYEDPEDKSGFRENRALSFSEQKRDEIGRFIKTESPDTVADHKALLPEAPALVPE